VTFWERWAGSALHEQQRALRLHVGAVTI